MIGLGAKYLKAAGFGRYRITAASLGNISLLSWLMHATVQAILGAFGDDGLAVINATNEYLNGIAASDRDKATALAEFINEDPMMVCSLGLEVPGVTMPIRWLVGDNASWVDSNITASTNTIIEDYVKLRNAVSSNRVLFGAGGWNTDPHLLIYEYENGRVGSAQLGGSSFTGLSLSWDTEYYLKIGFQVGCYVGTTKKMNATSATITAQAHIGIFATLNPNGTKNDGASTCARRKLVITKDGSPHEFVPFMSSTREGMVNITDVDFRPNIGTGHFSVAYTRNGQPWTPSTP